MKHISLFSGIGGFDLAAQWMGWENVAHCEWNPFGQRVLKYYWPNSISYHDITKTDFTIHRGAIDIVTGGFPCQPYSVAGKRKGKEDERHLWPEMLRAIREIQPRWVVGENVRGIINWDGGLVFNEVQADLEAEGYKILPFLLPAASVNAPHERYRTWFVAYSDSHRTMVQRRHGDNNNIERNASQEVQEWENKQSGINSTSNENDRTSFNAHDRGTSSGPGEVCKEDGEIPERHQDVKPCNSSDRNVTNTKSEQSKRLGPEQREACEQKQRELRRNGCRMGGKQINSNSNNQPIQRRKASRYTESERAFAVKQFGRYHQRTDWKNFPTQSPVCNGDDGIPSGLDGITFSKWRNESIKAGGNAIVPQVVYQIFKAIEAYESQ